MYIFWSLCTMYLPDLSRPFMHNSNITKNKEVLVISFGTEVCVSDL